MKVLIVASNKSGNYAPFVMDQVQELSKRGVEFAFFPITGKGLMGYLKSLPALKKMIKKETPDLVHAHFGLSGLLAVLQRKCPVVVTFHGSDVNMKKNWYFSKLAHWLSKRSIFVSEDLKRNLKVSKGAVIPCGIDTDLFVKHDKIESRRKLGMDEDKKLVLFSSSFSRPVKNYPLAKEAMDLVELDHVELIELKGYTREEIPIVMSAADCGLVTSHSESGPLFVKEAIACGLPVVSVNVGEVRASFERTQGNHLVDRDAQKIAQAITQVLTENVSSVSNGKEKEFCNKAIAERLEQVYINVITTK